MHYRFQPEWLCVTTVTSRGTLSEQQQRNIRGNIVSGLVRKRRVRETSYPKFWCHWHKIPSTTCNWPKHRCHLGSIRNIRGSIVSGLVRERRVRETSYPKFLCVRHQNAIATCNWPEQKCHLRDIWNVRGSIVSGLVRKRRVRETYQ